MNEERIKEIFSNEEFVKQLLKQEDSEQVQALLIEKDIDLSIEDICKIQELMIKQIKGEINLEELSEEELEEVTGGFGLTLVIGSIVCAIAGAVGGAVTVYAVYEDSGRRRW